MTFLEKWKNKPTESCIQMLGATVIERRVPKLETIIEITSEFLKHLRHLSLSKISCAPTTRETTKVKPETPLSTQNR